MKTVDYKDVARVLREKSGLDVLSDDQILMVRVSDAIANGDVSLAEKLRKEINRRAAIAFDLPWYAPRARYFRGILDGMTNQTKANQAAKRNAVLPATNAKRRDSRIKDEQIRPFAEQFFKKPHYTDERIAREIMTLLNERLKEAGIRPLGLDAIRKRVKHLRRTVAR